MTQTELITLLFDRPEDFGIYESIAKLDAFVNGYRNTVEIGVDAVAANYNHWLQAHLRISHDRGWVAIISFFGTGEADTFRLGKAMWQKYLSDVRYAKPLEPPTLVLSPIGQSGSSALLARMLETPHFYVGYESVVLIKAFMDGHERALRDVGIVDRDPLYSGFQTWVAERFKVAQRYDWASIISFMTGTESGAFKLVRELWQEYRAESERELQTA
ncbi:MAG: hypothetical protein LC113_10655 [Acidobacteria bacterium]|nr:hypothetical protein [Acidobacteriota bacterium]